jgi:hypothetical protein
MFNTCSYQSRYQDLRREAEMYGNLVEFKEFHRERRVQASRSWLTKLFSKLSKLLISRYEA